MQPSVLGLVHHTHPATTELLDDAVVRDGLADHLRECYGVRSGMSMNGLTAASSTPPWLPSGWPVAMGIYPQVEEASLWKAHAFQQIDVPRIGVERIENVADLDRQH